MEKIHNFINKWGLTISLVLIIAIFFNGCSVKSHTERLERKITSLEKQINYNDSLNREINSIEREISMLETAREVVYTNNAIVRTVARPDDVMNNYSQKIKALQLKKEKLNANRK
jgi:PBP1b-binding outer membrane lipoprotein LpoB